MRGDDVDVTPPFACPTCFEALAAADESGSFVCREDHRYSALGLALTTNVSALRALWMAIRALEDDAASLDFLATHHGDSFGQMAEARRGEAAATRGAAETLREHARLAQQRLDALQAVLPVVRDLGGSGAG